MSFITDIRVGTTGLKNFQNKLDVIGNNVANAGTVGFRRSKVTFIESYQSEISAAIPNSANNSVINPDYAGYGLVNSVIDLDMKPGEYTYTGNLLDLAVRDDGYFILELDGEQRYTRDGNLSIDANKRLVQETNGAYLKGWTASINADGSTFVDTTGPLQKIQFDKVQSIPYKPTTNVIFSSNLDHGSHVRNLALGNETVNVTDRYDNIQRVQQSVKKIDPDTYEITIKHEEQDKIKLKAFFNDLGDILNWELGDSENVKVQTDEQGQIRTLTFFYDAINKDGESVASPMTVTLPTKSSQFEGKLPSYVKASTDAIRRNIDLNMRPGEPEEQDYGSMPVGTLNTLYIGGRMHTTQAKLIDNEGQMHAAGITFEHVDEKTNTWFYRTSLPEKDPLIQQYLQDEDNQVLNPDRPSLLDLEEANQAVFGITRRGQITFSEGGFIDPALSFIPTLTTQSSNIERVEIGTVAYPVDDPEITRKVVIETDEDTKKVDEEDLISDELEFQLFARRKGLGAFYELILPADHVTIQAMARREKDPDNPELLQIVDPDNITEDELSKLNEELFNGSNQGIVFFDRNGKIEEGKSNIPEIKGVINSFDFQQAIPLSAFTEVPNLITSTGALQTGNLKVNYDMDLVTGFGGPFSTAVRETDGYESGNLKYTSITSNGDGTLKGRYTNGEERDIGQIGLAIFRNPKGLNKEGENLFSLSANSGFDENSIGAPNTATRGLVMNLTLELSNVSLPNEFTDLLLTQRAYQANSKVISTSDQALQTAINIKR